MDEMPSVKLVPRQYTKPRERSGVVAAWEESGMSAELYSARSGITVSTLRRWRRQAFVPPSQGALVELPPMVSGDWSAEVMSKAGSVRFSASALPEWAAALIRELNRC